MTLADRLFDAQTAYYLVESDLFEAALYNLGGIGDFDDVTADYYDRSMEIKGAAPGTTLTEEQKAEIWAWGFDRVWICRSDGTETYYSRSQS